MMRLFPRRIIPSFCDGGVILLIVIFTTVMIGDVRAFINGGVTTSSLSTSLTTRPSRTEFELFAVPVEELARREMLANRLKIQKRDSSVAVGGGEEEEEKMVDEEDCPEIENYETILESTREGMLGLRLDDEKEEQEEEKEEEEEVVLPPVAYFADVTTTTSGTTNSIDPPKSFVFDNSSISKNVALETIVAVAKEVAIDLLSMLRFGAANLLTSSLPDDQRKDLLQRMGASEATTTDAKSEMQQQQERGSIQEEIAVARAEEAQTNEQKWNKEKEEIIQQMEEAANERVKNELEIQKMRLEQELKEEQQLQQQEEEKKKIAASKKADNEEEKEREAKNYDEDLELLFERRKKQQIALDSIEEELRVSVENESEERERLDSLLEKRKGQQAELDAVEENLRIRVAEIEAEKEEFAELSKELEMMKLQQQLQEIEDEEKRVIDQIDEDGSDQDDDEDNVMETVHPVLGPVVADLGYKRLHFVSSGTLGTIPVWNRNRLYRNNRAKSMANEKIKSMELGFPGAICLHEDNNGRLSIVDGQHRTGMMVALRELIKKKVEKGEDIKGLNIADGMFERVLVEVYSEPTDNDSTESTEHEKAKDKYAQEVFLEINKAEPVLTVDMPGEASDADREVITDAVDVLQGQFSVMFSPSQRCKVPNVNVDNLRSSIFGAKILTRHNLSTSKHLVDWLLEQNAALGEKYENDEENQSLLSGKQWSKASKNNFYLGLESSWLYK